MKPVPSLLLFLAVGMLTGWKFPDNNWILEKKEGYDLTYTMADRENTLEYHHLLKNGIHAVTDFFGSAYRERFTVAIHPDRQSLDSTWQKDWAMPEFTSQCWMVASGTAFKLDIISPKTWDTSSCEHHYHETKKTQQLVTHELVHVYHGQLNASPDFSNVDGIDWFVEGLATYVSGQCDSVRLAEVKKKIADQTIPSALDHFWTGKIKYGLSGSVVMYIDHQYGRAVLKELLPFNKKSDILLALNTTEALLLEEWKKYILEY